MKHHTTWQKLLLALVMAFLFQTSALALPQQQDPSPPPQSEAIMPQEKKKTEPEEKKAKVEKKEESSMSLVKEMFQNALDFFYAEEEKDGNSASKE